MKKLLLTAATVLLAAMPALANEPVTISVARIKDLNIRLYGFLETDFIADTTQGFTEAQTNSLVPTRTVAGGGAANFAGVRHRTEMSVRDSRIGAVLSLPKTDSGLLAEGILEVDFLGNQGPNTTPGATPGAQTEANFYNNPSLRIRHAYANLTEGAWNAKLGQYWSLLGWQPYYFQDQAVVQAAPGQIFQRFPQARVTRTDARGDWTLETAADVARPGDMNSGNPEAHAGLRLASTRYKGACISQGGSAMVGLSAAVSAAVIPVATNGIGNPTGQAVAFDFLVPLIPSSDGKDRSNTLIWVGEFSSGSGVGGVEFTGLTFGVPGIAAATPGAGAALDAGIAGLNSSGNAELIRERSFRTHLEYSLPGGQWAVSAGYAQIEGRNLDRFSFTPVLARAIAPKLQFAYASVFYDAFAWLRFAGEINQIRDTYNDAANRFAINNRYQLSTYLMF